MGVSGERIAVGGLFDVFLFNSQGEFVSELTVPDGDIMFGNLVAMTEEVVVVGAFRDDEDMGSVHSYTASGNYLAKLGPPDGISNGQFGYDVAIFRDTVVIGAPFEGSAYLYSVDGT